MLVLHDEERTDPMTTPTTAHQATVALVHGVLVEAARRRQDMLPGLVETLQDDVVVTTGGTTRPAYGWFAEGAWRYGERRVHELFLNADRRNPHPSVSVAEDVLITLLHEGCHVWAQANDVRDVSRNGRYHNRRFAEIALTLGLAVERDPVIGHRTPSLSPWARADYADLLGELERGLVLAREPKLAVAVSSGTELDGPQTTAVLPVGPQQRPAKYVFASCQCQDRRGRPMTIRVATGSWRPGVICCSVCTAPFAESLTARRQSATKALSQ
jgi:hypothetical protein